MVGIDGQFALEIRFRFIVFPKLPVQIAKAEIYTRFLRRCLGCRFEFGRASGMRCKPSRA